MPAAAARIQRLNYIGSKYQLIGWLTDFMKDKNGLLTYSPAPASSLIISVYKTRWFIQMTQNFIAPLLLTRSLARFIRREPCV